MEIGICSFSFHRLLASGQQDIFKFIEDCKELGCTQLDPWMAHFETLMPRANNGHDSLSDEDAAYLDEVKRKADEAGLPFGCIAVDGAHIYEADADTRALHARRRDFWLAVAAYLGAKQIRVDSGGTPELTDEEMAIIVPGYQELIAKAQAHGIEILVENHWGPTVYPEPLQRLLDAVPGLGLLYDSHNFHPDHKAEARVQFAPVAKAVHIKTFTYDENGTPIKDDPGVAIDELIKAGYAGVWGVESTPDEADEITGARNTIAYIKEKVGV